MVNDNTHTDEEKAIVEAPKKNILKENWLKTDICCEKCGQVTERQRGITKQNIKRLFTIKFDLNEVIWTIVLILMFVSAYAYQQDIKVCRDYAQQQEADFLNLTGGSYSQQVSGNGSGEYTMPPINFTLITTINETES